MEAEVGHHFLTEGLGPEAVKTIPLDLSSLKDTVCNLRPPDKGKKPPDKGKKRRRDRSDSTDTEKQPLREVPLSHRAQATSHGPPMSKQPRLSNTGLDQQRGMPAEINGGRPFDNTTVPLCLSTESGAPADNFHQGMSRDL